MSSSLGENGVRPSLLNVDEVDDDEDVPGVYDGDSDDEIVDYYAEKDGEDTDSDSPGGEAEIPMSVSVPCKPDAKMVEEHNATHFPWRSWCEICVKGRAEDDGHRKKIDEPNEIPIVSMDYCYLVEETASKVKPVLVIKCSKSKNITATQVKNKGGDCEYAIKSAVRDIEKK